MTLTTSTVSNNIATNNGGGLLNANVLTVYNSTISGNRADKGGGLYNYATATVRNSTFTNNTANSGGGIYQDSSSSVVTLLNSIVAAQSGGGDCVGAVTANGFNLDSDGSCGDAMTVADPKLGPLQVNTPGNTATHALLLGSPAIDAGDNAACLATDQRGVVRPLDGNGDNLAICDLGAYEAPSATFATVTIVHDALPDSATNFRFSGGLGAFYLDDITPQDGDEYGNSKRFTVAPGVYNVTEVIPSTWVLASIVCNPAAKGTVNLPLGRVTLRVVAGDSITCTFTTQYTVSSLFAHTRRAPQGYNLWGATRMLA